MSEGRQQIGQARPQLGTMHDHVDGAMLKEELATLEAFRKLLADGLLDHARTGEAISALGSPTITSPSIARLAETPP